MINYYEGELVEQARGLPLHRGEGLGVLLHLWRVLGRGGAEVPQVEIYLNFLLKTLLPQNRIFSFFFIYSFSTGLPRTREQLSQALLTPQCLQTA